MTFDRLRMSGLSSGIPMRGVGTDIGTIHFIGIGGIGMSGLPR
jgi:hypothetical protein